MRPPIRALALNGADTIRKMLRVLWASGLRRSWPPSHGTRIRVSQHHIVFKGISVIFPIFYLFILLLFACPSHGNNFFVWIFLYVLPIYFLCGGGNSTCGVDLAQVMVRPVFFAFFFRCNPLFWCISSGKACPRLPQRQHACMLQRPHFKPALAQDLVQIAYHSYNKNLTVESQIRQKLQTHLYSTVSVAVLCRCPTAP